MKKLLFMCGVFYFYLRLVVLMMVLKKIALKRNLTRNKQNLRSLKRTKVEKEVAKLSENKISTCLLCGGC